MLKNEINTFMKIKLLIQKNIRAILSLVSQNKDDKCVKYLIESVHFLLTHLLALINSAKLHGSKGGWLSWKKSLRDFKKENDNFSWCSLIFMLIMNFFLMSSIRSDALVTFNCKTNSLPNPFYCNGIQMNFVRLHELVQW